MPTHQNNTVLHPRIQERVNPWPTLNKNHKINKFTYNSAPDNKNTYRRGTRRGQRPHRRGALAIQPGLLDNDVETLNLNNQSINIEILVFTNTILIKTHPNSRSGRGVLEKPTPLQLPLPPLALPPAALLLRPLLRLLDPGLQILIKLINLKNNPNSYQIKHFNKKLIFFKTHPVTQGESRHKARPTRVTNA